MTENKRFYISGIGISDRERKRLYDLKTVDGFISVRDLLNELNDENNELRQELNCEKPLFTKKRLHQENQELTEENEQLKLTINTLTCDNTKMKKVLNITKKENEQIKHLIKEAYHNERTKLGQSVLKQLLEAIQ